MVRRPAALALELTGVLEAPRQRVFELLTEPSELAKWWGPRGFTVPEVVLGLRVGDTYRFTMQPPNGEAFHLAGEFLEIDPPSRLTYTFRWEEPDPEDQETVVRLSLQPLVGATTEVSLWQGDFATQERLALHQAGWTESLEKLQELVDRI